MNLRAVRALLKQGLLKPKSVKDPATSRWRRYVCRTALQRFEAGHVTFADLAAQLGHLPSAASVKRNGQQVMPLSLDFRCTIIFRREDLCSYHPPGEEVCPPAYAGNSEPTGIQKRG